jgi:GNAT superfamily N-acetyltransferase
MQQADLVSAERASDATFLEADRFSRKANEPAAEARSASASQRWLERMRFYLEVDPAGCWVAAEQGVVAGFAFSQNRGGFWYLATYGVLPDHQGAGIGRQLMDAVLAHAGDRPGMFSSTVHPGATRRYRLAGFSLHPQMRMVGVMDRSTLPAISGLDEGEASDLEWMDQLDEELRGGGHGPDHRYMLERLRLIVARSKRKRGYAYVDEDRGRTVLLAAADVETAQTLLWEGLAASRSETLVNCITPANEWAVDVGLAARLAIGQEGYLAVRGMGIPAPYLPSGDFL